MTTNNKNLSIPLSGCGDIHIAFDGLQLRVRYEVSRDGQDLVGEVCFLDVHGFRFREEMLSCGREEGSYDDLVTVQGSEWLRDLETQGARGTDLSMLTHYAVFFSSNGYLEVVAEDVEVKDLEDGRLDLL